MLLKAQEDHRIILLQEAEELLKASTKGVSAKGKGAGASGGRASKKGKETPSKAQSGKGGADAGDDGFPIPQKPPSTMKKRGEEDNESKYIGNLTQYLKCIIDYNDLK